MGDEKSESSDVEVDNDSVFSDPREAKQIHVIQNSPQIIRNSTTAPLRNFECSRLPVANSIVPRRLIIPPPHSPRFIIAGPHAIPNLTTSVTESQVLSSSYMTGSIYPLPLPTVSSPHPNTIHRLEDARHKNNLAVYCNSVKGTKITATLDKSLFGSGSKGMCIDYQGERMTPRSFEVKCGLEKSRDWRRTIHYQGDTLKTLIQRKILKPHAQSCACRICSSDGTDSAPKYEEEVKSRYENRRRARDPADCNSARPVKKRIFFPQTESIAAAPATNYCTLLDNAIYSRINQDERTQLMGMLERFSVSQTNSQKRLNMILEKMEACRTELDILKETVLSEKKAAHQRDGEIANFLQSLSSSLEKSYRVNDRQSSVFSAGPQLINNGHHKLDFKLNSHPWSGNRTIRNEITTRNHSEPRSAPPAGSVRILEPHDRRRTSSDNIVHRSSGSQICSNERCEQQAAYMCQGCNKAIYCGKNCQEEAWNNGHDAICGEEDSEKQN